MVAGRFTGPQPYHQYLNWTRNGLLMVSGIRRWGLNRVRWLNWIKILCCDPGRPTECDPDPYIYSNSYICGKYSLKITDPQSVCDHTSYLSFFLHEHKFWRIKFTPKKRVNYGKIHSKLPFFALLRQNTQ